MIRLGVRPAHVAGLASLAPEAAKWLVQTLLDSEGEIRTNGAFNDESYACSARSAIARVASMAALADIKKWD